MASPLRSEQATQTAQKNVGAEASVWSWWRWREGDAPLFAGRRTHRHRGHARAASLSRVARRTSAVSAERCAASAVSRPSPSHAPHSVAQPCPERDPRRGEGRAVPERPTKPLLCRGAPCVCAGPGAGAESRGTHAAPPRAPRGRRAGCARRAHAHLSEEECCEPSRSCTVMSTLPGVNRRCAQAAHSVGRSRD